MINLDESHLKVLQFRLADLQGLTEEEQKKKLRKRYYRLAVRYHPDRGGLEGQFTKLYAAYTAILNSSDDDFRHEINNYFLAQVVNIPDTAFDLLTEEAIMNAYQELLQSFARLPETEKQQFAQQHASFISLAQSLEKKQMDLNQNRSDYFVKQIHEPLWQKYKYEWRKLIINLFAEEYLDDFQYRHALATGELSSILAWRKLLSPVKLIVAAINSLILAVTLSSSYLFYDLMLYPLINEFTQLGKDLQENDLSKSAVFIWVLKVVGLLVLVTVPMTIFPTTVTILLGVPLLGNLLNLLACPVNKLFRPLAQFTGLSPYLTGAGLITLLGALVFLMVSFFPPAALSPILIAASIALFIYSAYAIQQLNKKIYNVDPLLAYLQLFFLVVTIGISAAIIATLGGGVILDGLSDSITIFLINLFNAVVMYQANNSLDHVKEDIASAVEILPLPATEIPEDIRETVLQEVKTGHYSARFFNTTKTAHYIAANDRTFLQQVASFFGGGERNKPPTGNIVHEDRRSAPLSLTYAPFS